MTATVSVSTMKALREGIAANLGAIGGLQASAYMLANPTPPSAHVIPAAVDYDAVFQRGGDVHLFTVEVFVGLTTDRGAQEKLDTYLAPDGPYSVKAAIEADCQLGGAADDLRVTKTSGYRTYLVEGRGAVLGCQWEVEVRT